MRKLAMLLLLSACGADESYMLDGVSVVLERGVGPEKDNLTFATHLYRQAAEGYWEITSEVEGQTWRSIREIRWTQAPVLDGANFDPALGILSANWRGCTLSVPLYQALQFVYSEDVQDLDLEWAKELESESRAAVCVKSDPSIKLPW